MKRKRKRNPEFREILTCHKWGSSPDAYLDINGEEYIFGGETGPIYDKKGKIIGIGRIYKVVEYL